VGVENIWEEDKLEARKMLENSYSPHPSSARFVGRTFRQGFGKLNHQLNDRCLL
jgi:hypothetical protein